MYKKRWNQTASSQTVAACPSGDDKTADEQNKKKTLDEEDHCEGNDQNRIFVACTSTHEMELVGPFDFADYQTATNSPPFPPMLQKLIQRAIDFEVNPRPKPVYNLTHFSGVLREKQVEALEFILTRAPLPVILALDTGLGKTCVAYAYISVLWHALGFESEKDEGGRVLIVCPAGVRKQWLKEAEDQFFRRHSESVGFIAASKTADRVLRDKSKRIVIVGYSMLKALEEKLLTERWEAAIFDEAHFMQSRTAQCSKVVEKLRPHIQQSRLVLLTATPADKPTYWHLLRICDPEIFHSFFHWKPARINWPRSDTVFHFGEWYAMAERKYIANGACRWDFKRMLRRHELHALTKHFILRQKKEEVMREVAPLCLQKVNIGQSSLEEKLAFEQRMSEISEASEKKGHVYAKAMLLEQVRNTAMNKLPHVLRYIHQLLESSPSLKFIVWAYHKDVMEAIHESLADASIKHILVNGDTPQKQRDELFAQLKSDPQTRVAVLSLDACGTGLNFTFLQLTIYAELTFRYKSHIQSEGRCYRIGQKGQAVAQYLMYRDSTDDMVWNCLQRKRDNESILLENERASAKAETCSVAQALHFVLKHERLLLHKLRTTAAEEQAVGPGDKLQAENPFARDDDADNHHSQEEEQEEGPTVDGDFHFSVKDLVEEVEYEEAQNWKTMDDAYQEEQFGVDDENVTAEQHTTEEEEDVVEDEDITGPMAALFEGVEQ